MLQTFTVFSSALPHSKPGFISFVSFLIVKHDGSQDVQLTFDHANYLLDFVESPL